MQGLADPQVHDQLELAPAAGGRRRGRREEDRGREEARGRRWGIVAERIRGEKKKNKRERKRNGEEKKRKRKKEKMRKR